MPFIGVHTVLFAVFNPEKDGDATLVFCTNKS
jgi:hypothetical protein